MVLKAKIANKTLPSRSGQVLNKTFFFPSFQKDRDGGGKSTNNKTLKSKNSFRFI